jgi:hypothetical protein
MARNSKSIRRRIKDKAAERKNRPGNGNGTADKEKMASLFAAVGLDPDDPSHRQELIATIAELYCGSQQRGRRPIWTPAQLAQLCNDVTNVAAAKPNWSNSRICRQLVSLDRYAKFKSATLRRRLPDAGKWRKQQALKRVANGRSAGKRPNQRVEMRRVGKGWRSKPAPSARQLMLAELVDFIATAWRRTERRHHRLPNKIGSKKT